MLGLLGALMMVAATGSPQPRLTHDGTPDLQGVWTNASVTPLERPTGVETLDLDPVQAAALEKRLDRENRTLRNGPIGQYDSEWHEGSGLARIDGQARSSVIVDPIDGRLPYSPQGRARLKALGARPLNGPEDSAPTERCLSPGWSAAGPPMLTAVYSPNYKIVQTKGEVAILAEVNSALRVIHLNAAHGGLPAWMGDSVGRWEGGTLVVETIGFAAAEGLRSPLYLISPQARVTERFTRLSSEELRYTFTVEDPAIYTRPWSGEVPLRITRAPIYEFACHEGNYSMAGMLAGARRVERLAAEPANAGKAP